MPAPATAEAFVAYAMSALDMPTTYWLDFGGYGRNEPARSRPGTPIVARQELNKLLSSPDPKRKAVGEQYLQGAAQAGIDIDAMPGEACDCTNFLCWSLGVARDSGPGFAHGGRINSTNIIDDAEGAQRLFVPLRSARAGAVLVFKAAGNKVGHAGIVTEVDASGRATRVLHCAPENYAGPPTSAARNAIAITSTERFDAEAQMGRLKIVWWKAFAG
jgi:hypothetical protein